jgi:menaquinol-cytochrome c reductase iron-sulfur subunit
MPGQESEARRGFLKAITGALGAVMGAVALIPGLGFLAHPLRRPTVTGGDDPLRVASPGEVKPGKPVRVAVIGRRRDAWLRLDRVKLGAAWLVRERDGAPIKAFSTICPHLGCGIDWNDKTRNFDCPCHDSNFDLQGRCLRGPSPRGLDELDVVASGEDVKVRYRRFKTGIAKKEPIG